MTEKDDEQYIKLKDEAWNYYQNDNPDKAFENCKSLINLYPQKISGYYLSGIIENGKRNYVKSVDFLKNALDNDIDNNAGGFIHYLLGKNYNEKSKSDWLDEFEENPFDNFEMAQYSFEKSIEYENYPENAIVELIKIYRKDDHKIVNILMKAI